MQNSGMNFILIHSLIKIHCFFLILLLIKKQNDIDPFKKNGASLFGRVKISSLKNRWLSTWLIHVMI